MINIGMRGHDFVTSSIDELSSKCAEYDIHEIQLALAKSENGFRKNTFSPAYARSIKKSLDANGVNVTILGCYINPVNCDNSALRADMDYFVENLKYAKFLEADAVGLETGFVGKSLEDSDNDTEEAYQKLLKNMTVLKTRAEKLGVMIAVEGVHCFVISSPEKMKRLIDDLDSPNILTIIDPVNYLNAGNYKNQQEIITKAFELLCGRIAAIHLKDFDIKDGRLISVLPGCGKLDYKLIFSLAEKYAPNVPMLLEEVKEPDVKQTVKRLRDIDSSR